jgi:putative membrane protein
VLGCGYAALAVGLLIVGARRQRELERAMRTGNHVPLRFRTVGLFTAGGIGLAVMTVVLVVAQT